MRLNITNQAPMIRYEAFGTCRWEDDLGKVPGKPEETQYPESGGSWMSRCCFSVFLLPKHQPCQTKLLISWPPRKTHQNTSSKNTMINFLLAFLLTKKKSRGAETPYRLRPLFQELRETNIQNTSHQQTNIQNTSHQQNSNATISPLQW